MIDSEITLKKLEIFLAFMEKENIGRAAEQLGLSSVSVHRALHTLEEGFRCPLFIHKGATCCPCPQHLRWQNTHAISWISPTKVSKKLG